MLQHRHRVNPSRAPLLGDRLVLDLLDRKKTNIVMATKFAAWLNDEDVVRYSEQRHHVHTPATQMRYWVEADNDAALTYWFIKIKDTGATIGSISMTTDKTNRVGNIGILLGEKTEWGKGYGLEAWTLVSNWAAFEAQLYRTEAGFMAKNNAMRQLCLSAKMKPEGICRSYFQCDDGSRCDKIIFGRLL